MNAFRRFVSFVFYCVAFVVLIKNFSDNSMLAIFGAIVLASIGYACVEGVIKKEKELAEAKRAHEEHLDVTDPFGGVSFNISVNAAFYDRSFTREQAWSCAHTIARELSIEFLGLRVFLIEGSVVLNS